MSKGLSPIKRSQSMPDYVRRSIQKYIIDNELRPGDPIPSENELSRQLGVGRNSVREAVKALESLGVLKTRRGSGIYVREFSLDPLLESIQYQFLFDLQELRDFIQVRVVLELGMIESALQNMTDDQVALLESIVERMRVHAERGESFPEQDREFHHCLFEPAQNSIILKMLDVFWVTHRKAIEHLDVDEPVRYRVYQDHVAILDAVKARDVRAAKRALLQHYAVAERRVARVQATLKSDADEIETPTSADAERN